MGHCPSPNLSMVAMHKTANLNNNEKDYPVAYKALVTDSYVDNTFTGAENHEKVREKIEEIETVGAMGGFSYKEWVISGQKAPDQTIGVQLANQIAPDEERALGVQWDVENDLFL